ncbi:MAG: hypothetical protein AAGE03_04470 [Pseudomonadota bacterium]
MSAVVLTPAARAAHAMCKVHLHRCRCASQGLGTHCVHREVEARTVMAATGLTDDEVGKIMTGPVRVTKKAAKKGGSE